MKSDYASSGEGLLTTIDNLFKKVGDIARETRSVNRSVVRFEVAIGNKLQSRREEVHGCRRWSEQGASLHGRSTWEQWQKVERRKESTVRERKKGSKWWKKEGMKRRECHPDTTITYPPLSSSTSRLPLPLPSFLPRPSFFLSSFFPLFFDISILPPTYTFPYLYRSLLCDSFLFLRRNARDHHHRAFHRSFHRLLPYHFPFPVLQFRGFLARFVSFELEKERERERREKKKKERERKVFTVRD